MSGGGCEPPFKPTVPLMCCVLSWAYADHPDFGQLNRGNDEHRCRERHSSGAIQDGASLREMDCLNMLVLLLGFQSGYAIGSIKGATNARMCEDTHLAAIKSASRPSTSPTVFRNCRRNTVATHGAFPLNWPVCFGIRPAPFESAERHRLHRAKPVPCRARGARRVQATRCLWVSNCEFSR
jgi:hypothetical protein